MPIYKANGKKDGLQKYIVRVNYISDSGKAKQLSRVAYGLDSAKDLERKLDFGIKNQSEIATKKMTVQDLFNEFMAIKKIEVKELTIIKTTGDFKYYILPFFKDLRIDRLTVNMLQEWKIFMEEKNLSLSTKSSAFINFKSIFNYAILMEYIIKNPFSKIKNFRDASSIKKEMQVYTSEEFKIFIKKAREIAEGKERLQNSLSEWNYFVFFNIAFYTGLRKGEIHALKWSDIQGDYLSVNRSISQRLGNVETRPKNKSSIRKLKIPLPLMHILNEHKQRHKLFHNFSDDFRICNNIRNTSIQRRNEIYSADLNKTIRIHDFRHSNASVMANKNVNIQEISRRLGHSNVEITWNTYCHIDPEAEQKAIDVFN